ncbi:hypothetical protein ACFC08_17915 [Streptomyces sp. NPDC056112]|uniref:hypothetical protein n=1 Tax=Streptomyces sp. NPDC056112 TaxID=3345715 RepID=UPI0035DC346F
MFKTGDTRRIRLRGGTRVHDVPIPHTRPMTTACGKRIHLFDARGRLLDRPLSGSTDIAVTCPACLRAIPAT